MTDIEKTKADIQDIQKNLKRIKWTNDVLLPCIAGALSVLLISAVTYVSMDALRLQTIAQTKQQMIEEGWTPPSTNCLTATPVQE